MRYQRGTFRGSVNPAKREPYWDGKYEYPLGCNPPDNTDAALKQESHE
jgi:hypothetical protein